MALRAIVADDLPPLRFLERWRWSVVTWTSPLWIILRAITAMFRDGSLLEVLFGDLVALLRILEDLVERELVREVDLLAVLDRLDRLPGRPEPRTATPGSPSAR